MDKDGRRQVVRNGHMPERSVLTGIGDKKIQVIKVVRSVTNLGLKEAKELVEGVPSTVKEAIPKDEAEKIKKDLEEAGGSAEIK